MQERRATIRVPHRCRTQYCPSEDFLPRDGHVVNLSERGAGLLSRKAHQAGERITLSVQLPGENGDPVIATGLVRWIGRRTFLNRWYPVGLEWLPLEDAARDRLHRFLYASARPQAAHARAPEQEPLLHRFILYVAIGCGILLGVFVYQWARSLQEENVQWAGVVEQRNARIAQLESHARFLTAELGTTTRYLEDTTSHLDRLTQQAQALGSEVGQLKGYINQFQRSYEAVRAEREQLVRQVLDLEQERMQLSERLSSEEELRVAIRDAVQRRKAAQRAQRLSRMHARRARARQPLKDGNQGFVIRNGVPAVTHSTVWIRVQEPEAVPDTPPTITPLQIPPPPAVRDDAP